MNEKKLNEGIDFLRGFSILSVILLHCYIHLPLPNNTLPPQLANLIFRSGYYGVIVFFVISGFLITSTSLDRWGSLEDLSVLAFYKIRFARIAPCLMALLAILSLLHLLGIKGFILKKTSLSEALFSALTFQVNWLEAKLDHLPANWDVLWSLSIEEVFYLFFPLVCVTFKKPLYFSLTLLPLLLIGPFARVAFSDNDSWSDHSYFSCMDGIAVGCLCALVSRYLKLSSKKIAWIFCIGAFLFSWIFIFRKRAYDWGLPKLGLNVTLLEMGTGFILIAFNDWYIKRKHSARLFSFPLRWLGRNSYEIYLTHSFFVIMGSQIAYSRGQPLWLILFWYLAITLLSGITGQLVATYYSLPMNQRLRKALK